MNIKKYSLKTMCAALACTTVLSSMLAAYATNTTVYETPMDDSVEINSINTLSDDSTGTGSSDSGWTTEENSFEDIKVTYQQSSSYFVTIPKTIALGVNKQATYDVKVTGDIDTKQRVYVAPVDGINETADLDFYMKEKDNKKENVVAKVTQNKIYWSSEDVANSYEETNNSVSAPDLTAGTWEGTFQVEIRLETNVVQDEEETDPYETAPAEAYGNWDYTLDDTNNIITLNYYKGSETDVIVYANYEIDGKTYKTQLASNSASADYKTPYMFNCYAQANCLNIQSITFSKDIDTSNVANMNSMFHNCQSLTSLDLSNLDTSNVTNMSYMFQGCYALTNLDVSNFDTSNVTDMSEMFMLCKSLVSLNLSNFDTSNVVNMSDMFFGCYALTNLDLSNFDTNNVTNMSNMFCCGNINNSMSLTSLDLSSFDTSNVTNMNYMFEGCRNLKTIYVTSGKWSTSQAKTSYMFNNCGTSEVTYK